ncbi:hypothetical protein [Kouleothrix sp.]|uniref:hypothetical protein n=1 Tax=Kouleothrix sp. TaxID=2779161 RepID=UPI00391CAB80
MEDVTFTRGPARRPMPRVADPLLQWATGLQTKERRIYAGWLVEAGKIEALDEAMAAANFSQVTIKHGSGNMVTHWAVETANLFVVAEGVQSIGEMKHTEERYGIAFGWRTLEGGRQQSVLRFRGFLQELLNVGFYEPLLITAKSTLTGDLIAALTRQYEVLDAVDAFRALDKKPPLQAPFYACSIPLGPGQEVARGSGGQTKEITPPIALVPAPISKEYIRAHWIKREWAALIEGGHGGPSLIDQTIAWSVTTSKLIGIGEEQPGGAPLDEEPAPQGRPAPAAAPGPRASANGNGRRQLEESLL